jgi:hypothetical protein
MARKSTNTNTNANANANTAVADESLHGAMTEQTTPAGQNEPPEMAKLQEAISSYTTTLANTREGLLSAREASQEAKTIGTMHREAFERVMSVEGIAPVDAVAEVIKGIGRYVSDWVAGNPMPKLAEGVKQSDSEEFKTWRDKFNNACYHPIKRSTEKVLMRLVLAGELPTDKARISITPCDATTKAPKVTLDEVKANLKEHDVVAEAAKALALLNLRHKRVDGELVYTKGNKPELVAASPDRQAENMERFVLAMTQTYRYADLIAAIEKARIANGDAK